MTNNCMYLKQKMNKSLYCKYIKKEINIKECSNCEYKLFKKVNGTEHCRLVQTCADLCRPVQRKCTEKSTEKSTVKMRKTPLRKNKSNKLAKLERKRFSLIYTNLNKCACCPGQQVHKNEVFEGAKRSISMKYGFVIPLCPKHHDMFHNNREFALKYKKMFQKEFEKTHTREEFLKIIHHNYLD